MNRLEPQVLSSRRVWNYRDFLNEKVRPQDRYWRCVDQCILGLPSTRHDNELWIVPDALSWRKYLPLMAELLQRTEKIRYFLLESVVEFLDYRNSSPCILPLKEDGRHHVEGTRTPEAAASRERAELRKLLENNPTRVKSFCDLSVRQTDHDEWEMMDYPSLNVEERSQHALLRAATMLRHEVKSASFQGSAPRIIVLASDEDSMEQYSTDDAFDILSMTQVIGLLTNENTLESEELEELRERCSEAYSIQNQNSSRSSRTSPVGHLTESDLLRGLRNEALCKGKLLVSKENPREAFVRSSTNGVIYYVNQERGHFNRAINNDLVVVRPLQKSEWGSPMGRRRLTQPRDHENHNDSGMLVASAAETASAVPSAEVVGILETARRQFVATLVDLPNNDENVCLVIPMDYRIPKIRVKTSGWKRFVDNRLLVQIDQWDVDSTYPAGHCVRILGPIADQETEVQCLLHENSLQFEPFSVEARAAVPPTGSKWTIPSEELGSRLDLRTSHEVFSVDPNGCQDIDDSMHARELPNGDVEIGVHIADVTHFVPHNSALDKEAQVRGTTFYLVDRRFDMLPSLLSSDLCSLHGGLDRLAVSTIWIFSKDFNEVKSFWYGRTVVHNCQAMTYEQAHNILHDKPPDDENATEVPPLTAGYPVDRKNVESLKVALIFLTRLARSLRRSREDVGGAVDLSSGDQGNELKFTLDDFNNPTKVTPKKQLEIHATIAELMILANTWVAKIIHSRMPDQALLRVHQSADESRFEELDGVMKTGKVHFDARNNMALASSLKRAEETASSRSLVSFFKSLATRAMSEAQYVSTGQVSSNNGLSHYGLGLEKYTHFTSPIRRYADVIVHRQLLWKEQQRAPGFRSYKTARQVEPLPSSTMISVLEREGLKAVQPTPETPSFVVDQTHQINSDRVAENITDGEVLFDSVPYTAEKISTICDRLNRQNRLAKYASFACQTLFLSLYFKQNTEYTEAVVTNLRANGVLVYVPKFDFRGAIFLTDSNGKLQIDPALIKLPLSAGEAPSTGFAASSSLRSFPTGTCQLLETDTGSEVLEVSVQTSKHKVRLEVLDVVKVKIFTNNWDTRSRVPLPRVYLIGACKRKDDTKQRTSTTNSEPASQHNNQLSAPGNTGHMFRNEAPTIYAEFTKLRTPSILGQTPIRARTRDKKLVADTLEAPFIPGRLNYGGFRNPNTYLAKQEAAMAEASEAARERRNQLKAAQEKKNQYSTSGQIGKDATARMQRLAAHKRNARRKKK